MKTKLTTFFAIIALTLIASSCSDILNTPDFKNKGNKNTTEKGLLITVSGGELPSRTLYPDANFTRYELDFENTDGTETYGPLTLTGEASKLISDLPAGAWKVTATGYVTIDGTEYAAAQGEGTATVTAGSVQNLGITISASQTGDNGFFSYSVSFPDDVNWASLQIREFDGEWWGGWGDGTSFNLLDDPAGSVELSPGYYIMTVRLYNSYQTVGKMEAVHIYPNMETRAVYNFTADDFTTLITLSGTLDITNTTLPSSVTVRAYTNPDYTGDSVGSAYLNPNDGNNWTMKIPAFDTDTALYFQAQAYFRNGGENDNGPPNGNEFNVLGNTGVSVTANSSDIGNIALSVTFPVVTLSGTITVNGAAELPYHTYIRAEGGNTSGYVSIDRYGNDTWNGNTCTWAVTMPSFTAETDVSIRVNMSPSDVTQEISKTVKDENVDNIDFTFAFTTLSGTADITVNGGTPEDYATTVYAYTDADYQDWPYWHALVDLKNGGAWAMSIPPFETDTVLYFQVSVLVSGMNKGYVSKAAGTVTVKNEAKDGIALDPVEITVITVNGMRHTDSGRIYALNTDSITPYELMYNTYSSTKVVRYTDAENGQWSMMFFDTEPTNLWFAVEDRSGFFDVYITKTAVDITSGTVALDTADMDELGWS